MKVDLINLLNSSTFIKENIHFTKLTNKSFLSLSSEIVCCGTIYKGPNGEVLIDPRFLKPCAARMAMCKVLPSIEKAQSSDISSTKSSTDSSSDSSSDSGYDESSNPGAEKDTATYKKEEFLETCEISISPIAVGN